MVPSASLIPHDPTVLFTVAGMVPFKPYFVGDEAAPWPRATSIQKCVRAGGKHNDLDDIGRTNRHFSFFEMMGNFSFGDYFKPEAIAWAWEFVTDVLALDLERLWVTVHESDDEAASIWRDTVGLAPDRIQRLGDDNFWRMADTGPCGPSSEIFWDLGEAFGAGGGPATGDPDRFIEIWNLVFMQFDQRADGQAPLRGPSIDTGAGLERMLMALQGVDSIFDIDVFRPLVQAAEKATGLKYGTDADRDLSLRILAEHARTMTFLVADGVVPSNEERGYVLRRIIRRAVRHAYLLGATELVTPQLVDATVSVMGSAYPEIVKAHDNVTRCGPERRGALPPDAGARPDHARRHARSGRHQRRRRVPPARFSRLPRGSDARDRERARSKRRSRWIRHAHGVPAHARTRGKEGYGRHSRGAGRDLSGSC